MKLPFTIYDLRFTIRRKSAKSAADRQSSIVNRQSECGVALVITLILLSVALVMTLAFLAISGHEQGSVTTQTDAATTRYAADAGLAVAEAQIAANILSSTNPYSFGLVVSTNYDTDDSLTGLTNLLISPRAPVWLTNYVLRAMENRFYLDLNRNGRDDPNGWLTTGDPEWIGVLAHPDRPYAADNPFIARFAFLAMPAGNSLDVNAIHNQALSRAASQKSAATVPIVPDFYFRNQGVGSWEINLAAFLTDLNTNEWDPPADPYNYQQWLLGSFGNVPNSGRGFEDAFAVLTNRYAGLYDTLPSVNALFGATGAAAFTNDVDGYDDGPLMSSTQLPARINSAYGLNLINYFWLGGDNTNHYVSPQELFNPGETAGFAAHLLDAGMNPFGSATNSTYNRSTFYRLLSQLSTDSAPESGKMNLNYDNLDPGFNGVYNTNGVASQTNFMAWTPLGFFTNAADRLLHAYTAQWAEPDNNTGVAYGSGPNTIVVNSNFVGTFNVTAPFGVTDIPVWVSNRFVYTPAVQRLLQLAANTYDASTNSYFPSVFRPTFWVTNEFGFRDVYINGYQQVLSVAGTNDPVLALPEDVSVLAGGLPGPSVLNYFPQGVNVYGVPWIIGAKKGFPNFNEFVQENIVGVTRRLQLTRDLNYESQNRSKVRLTGTNQMYLFSLNSSVGLDFWNSYNSTFTDNVSVSYRVSTSMSITNDEPGFDNHPGITQPMGFSFAYTTPLFSGWPSSSPWVGGLPNPGSFDMPLNYLDYPVMVHSVYRTGNAGLTPGTLPAGFTAPCLITTNYFGLLGMPTLFETSTPGFPLPHFGLLATNRLQVFILDVRNGITNVIDYAQLEQMTSRDLNAEIFSDDPNGAINSSANVGIWNTNVDFLTGVPYGIENQIKISRGIEGVQGEDGLWQGDAEALLYGATPPVQQASFQAFFMPYGSTATAPSWGGYPQGGPASNYLASVAAPYAPTRYAVGYTVLQANDPLVHYLTSDMTPSPLVLNVLAPNMPTVCNNYVTNIAPLASLNLGSLNDNYQPWDGNPAWAALDPDRNNRAERDPLVRQSDNWNFPTNKFPTVGWLGRVHRGTPWQTVYLKSQDLLRQNGGFNTWRTWDGNPNQYDANNAAPVADRLLFDLFTTALNDNATRGTLSVNVGADQYDSVDNPAAGLASWSALFSGVVVPTGGSTNSYTVINPAGPAGVNSALGSLVTNINFTRSNFRNNDGLAGSFERKGDILSVPLLSDQSPFLDPAQTALNSDAMYEWLPQQVLSLLRVGTPRYVIYSYGQALKPAPAPNNGVFVGGSYLPTNYQVVAETATRAVVRFDAARTNVVTGGTNAVIVSPPRVTIEQFNILPPD